MYGCMDGAQVTACTTVYDVGEDMTRFDGKLQVSLSPSVVLVTKVVSNLKLNTIEDSRV